MDNINSGGIGVCYPHKLACFINARNDFPARAATGWAVRAGAGFDALGKLVGKCGINRHADVGLSSWVADKEAVPTLPSIKKNRRQRYTLTGMFKQSGGFW